MKLSTRYLGIPLAHPLIPGASPLSEDLDAVKMLVDEGAPMIVMHSIFEEQIVREQTETIHAMEAHAESFGEALSFFPRPVEFRLGPEQYLDQIRRIKETTGVPVVASLNGATPAGWLDYARLIEQAGADAIELNMFFLPIDFNEDSKAVENRVVEAVKIVRGATTLPIAVKLAPFWSAFPNLAKQLQDAGANGLVLFNRFYQPDINIETLDAERSLHLSDSSELPLRLRWVAILYGRIRCELAVTGGVHTHVDAIKAVMAGAQIVQITSALLKYGADYFGSILDGWRTWLDDHGYQSIDEMRGSMSLERCPDPHAYTRGDYMRMLQSWRT